MNSVSSNHLNVALHVSGGKDVSVFWATGTAPLRCRGSGQGEDYHCYYLYYYYYYQVDRVWARCGSGARRGVGVICWGCGVWHRSEMF